MPRLVEETYRTLGRPGAGRATLLMEELGLLEPLVPFLSEQLRRIPTVLRARWYSPHACAR